MKQFARSVPVILFLSVASLSLIALAGCGTSGNGNLGPTAAKNIYAIQDTSNAGIVQDSVLVFSASATGSTTPTSTLTLPSNFVAYSVAAGPQGQIYISGFPNNDSLGYGQILEYAAGSSGSATPTVTLNGALTGSFTYPGPIAVNSAGTLFVSSYDGSLEAFASGITASSVPTRYLTWGLNNYNLGEEDGGYIGVDTAGDIFYMDYYDDLIDVFAANATGATGPARTITGTNTNLFTQTQLENIAVDGAGDVYVANYNSADDPDPTVGTNPGTYAANKRVQAMGLRWASHLMARPHVPDVTGELTEIIEFAAGASGNATPTKRIGGAATNIVEPEALAVDAVGNLYYADANGAFYTDTDSPLLLEVFSSSATGNVAPAASITLTGFTADNVGAIAIR